MPKVFLVQAERIDVFQLSFSARFSKALESAFCHLFTSTVPFSVKRSSAFVFSTMPCTFTEPSIASQVRSQLLGRLRVFSGNTSALAINRQKVVLQSTSVQSARLFLSKGAGSTFPSPRILPTRRAQILGPFNSVFRSNDQRIWVPVPRYFPTARWSLAFAQCLFFFYLVAS